MNDFSDLLEELEQRGMRRFPRTLDGAQGPRMKMDGRDVLVLCSNNYLGLANHPHLVEAAARATRDLGTSSGASRLVSGSMRIHDEFEQRLADFKGTEAGLLFNSGYAANIGILQGLAGPGDVIFSDALNHASIIDGCRLSAARVLVYPHTDVQALEDLMQRERPDRKGHWFIVTDGVFSMDGDLAPLPELVALKKQYDALLMVDDAHGTGVLGDSGRGSGEHFGCLPDIDLHMGTLGKALGGFGAYLASSRAVVDLLINRARSLIFSTSLPPGVVAAGLEALAVIESDEGRRRRQDLWSLRELFAGPLREAGFDLCGSVTQIVPVLTGEPGPTMEATSRLLEAGIFLQGIRPPTVPEGKCRLRATLMSDHDPQDISHAAATLMELLGESR
ncbi:8-amino-7-oxononanoate synthase [Geoalkalibacter subterraneus]|uniref:8-amino-7-ketopelargonate synthase n=1 Tax=Geoalkalibacter subterraneus TaxID=483547 RepID=A0A0B5FG04_9BACT|nr:8-amino-7-oxononanoate synthase [Geoalkalibacter subterraneus]AJF07052.1 8-amino-7-oxononanoate synthase [Geoalkalibacter subterraneus]